MSKKNQRGFTLIELMVTCAIVAILAALAVASYRRAILYANEASAVHSIDQIKAAQAMYRYQFGGYTDLPTLGAAGMIDQALLRTKHGYDFNIAPNNADPTTGAFLGFEAEANPHQYDVTGYRSFCTNETGTMKWINGALGTTVGICNDLVVDGVKSGTL